MLTLTSAYWSSIEDDALEGLELEFGGTLLSLMLCRTFDVENVQKESS
jgi:hypothetical protein